MRDGVSSVSQDKRTCKQGAHERRGEHRTDVRRDQLAHEGTPSCLRRLSRGLRRDARGQHEKAFAQSERARARARVVQGVK